MSGEHPMDDRREYRGSTLVYCDRYGPREFWRNGQQLSCICDPERGIRCAYHGRIQEQAPHVPREEAAAVTRLSRAQRVAGHLPAARTCEQAGQFANADQHYLAALQIATTAERPAIQEAMEWNWTRPGRLWQRAR